MLDNIQLNNKSKNLSYYTKFANPINYFSTANSYNSKSSNETLKISNNCEIFGKNEINYFSKKNYNFSKNIDIDDIKSIFKERKNILDKNLFGGDLIKREKWESLKKEICQIKNKNFSQDKSTGSNKIKNNLYNLKNILIKEENFQKNLKFLNDKNLIFPKNFNDYPSNSINKTIKYNDISKVNDISKNFTHYTRYNNYIGNFSGKVNNEIKNITSLNLNTTGYKNDLTRRQISNQMSCLEVDKNNELNFFEEKRSESSLFYKKNQFKKDIFSVLDNKNLFSGTTRKRRKINKTNSVISIENNKNCEYDSLRKINNIFYDFFQDSKYDNINLISKNSNSFEDLKNKIENKENFKSRENKNKNFSYKKTNLDFIKKSDYWSKYDKKTKNYKELLNSENFGFNTINLNCYNKDDKQLLIKFENLKIKSKTIESN